MTPEAGLFFAAGFGTRMRPLTLTRPKPLIRVGDRTLLDHALAQGTGLARRVVNAHYLAEQITAHLAERDVRVSIEAPDILDTGGGLRHALPMLGPGPVFTLNTDAVWDGPSPLQVLSEAWDPVEADALLLCIPRDAALGHAGRGDFLTDAKGRLHYGPGAVYTGAQIVAPEALDGIPGPVFSMRAVWDRLIARGRLRGLLYPGRWCDVGRPENLALAETLL